MNIWDCFRGICRAGLEKKVGFFLFLFCFLAGIVLRIFFPPQGFFAPFFRSCCDKYLFLLYEGNIFALFFSRLFSGVFGALPFFLPAFCRPLAGLNGAVLLFRGYLFACGAAVLCSAYSVVGVFAFLFCYLAPRLLAIAFWCALGVRLCYTAFLRGDFAACCRDLFPYLSAVVLFCLLAALSEIGAAFLLLRPFCRLLY